MIYLQEGSTFTKDRWVEILQITSDEISSLLLSGIFKTVFVNNSFQLQLLFVGEMLFKNDYAISFPKCVSKKNFTYTKIKLIRYILKQYFNSRKKQDAVFKDENENIFFNDNFASKEYEIYIALRNYFQNKGNYKKKEIIASSKKVKSIEWKKTIKNSIAYIDQDNVIYPSPQSKSIIDYENDVTEIFKCIITYLADKYELDSIKHYINVNCESRLSIDELIKNKIRYCNRIKNELSHTYNSEDIFILNLILDYLELNYSYSGKNEIKLFGTTSFHVIWEFICSTFFKNEYSQVIDNFAHPKWYIENTYFEKNKFIPDILLHSNENLFILDAKYYYPIPDKVCGASDIAKQFIYAQVSPYKKIMNFFIFPFDDDKLIECSGYVSVFKDKNELPHFQTQRIHTIKLSLFPVIEKIINKEHESWDKNNLSQLVVQ
ncbi:TPA: LlaJI family restriction endonuclease [Acinetobacter baumannii]|nr:LlaJI family restriction endonuclease [Acinetobacter baumannii]